MCGRYVTPDQAAIERAWDVRISKHLQREAFNNFDASPAQRVPLLRAIRESGGQKELIDARWGLIPHWARGEVPKHIAGNPLMTFNARIETLRTLASFRGAWERGQRCLIPMRGFYEWQAQPPDWQQTVRHYICVEDQELLCFAGLWDSSKKPHGPVVESVTVITLPANGLMKTIHNSRKRGGSRQLLAERERRMPAILRREAQDTWLTGTPAEAWRVLEPYPSERMSSWPVAGPGDPKRSGESGADA